MFAQGLLRRGRRPLKRPILPGFLSRLLEHIDYVVNLVGEDHVGLGSDFDGISLTPRGINDVSDMPEITRAMLEQGYSSARIRKILGENFMRVFEQVTR